MVVLLEARVSHLLLEAPVVAQYLLAVVEALEAGQEMLAG